ncbi:MAG: hypothetical protein QXU42_07700 [Thermoproteota archaeon]
MPLKSRLNLLRLGFDNHSNSVLIGLIYRMHDPDVVILLFTSGKLVCTGAVNEKMVYDAVEKLMAELIQKGLLII